MIGYKERKDRVKTVLILVGIITLGSSCTVVGDSTVKYSSNFVSIQGIVNSVPSKNYKGNEIEKSNFTVSIGSGKKIFRITAYDKLAIFCQKKFSIGTRVWITGQWDNGIVTIDYAKLQ